MAKKIAAVSLTVNGTVGSDKFPELVSKLPWGAGYSAQVAGPEAGMSAYSISSGLLTVAEAQAFLTAVAMMETDRA